MSLLDNFLTRYPTGSKIDVDGFPKNQPYQCFDAAIVYVRLIANDSSVYIVCRSTGLAQDWWNDFESNGLSKWFTRVPANQPGLPGDIVLWGRVPTTPDSHVAVLLEDRGATKRVYGQNQPHPYTTITDLTSKGLLGYLRMKGGSVSSPEEIDKLWKAVDATNKRIDAITEGKGSIYVKLNESNVRIDKLEAKEPVSGGLDLEKLRIVESK